MSSLQKVCLGCGKPFVVTQYRIHTARFCSTSCSNQNKKITPLAVRFERHYTPEPNSGCWLWTGSIDAKGYGQLRDGGRNRIATHVALELAGRSLPAGLCACHHCDNPACVNADHIFVGTHKANTRDMMAKGRASKPPVRIGEHNNSAKLTSGQVVAIKTELAAGRSLRSLAAEYGLVYTHISSIKRGKTWRHVEVPQ